MIDCFDGAAAEIVAYDAVTQRAYVVNGGDKTLDILDISDPTAPALVSQLDMTAFGDAATSVDINAGLVAVAVPAAEKTDPGQVIFLDTDGALLAADASPTGQPLLVVANEVSGTTTVWAIEAQ